MVPVCCYVEWGTPTGRTYSRGGSISTTTSMTGVNPDGPSAHLRGLGGLGGALPLVDGQAPWCAPRSTFVYAYGAVHFDRRRGLQLHSDASAVPYERVNRKGGARRSLQHRHQGLYKDSWNI